MMLTTLMRQFARARYAGVTSAGYRAADRPVAGGRVDADIRVMLVGTGLSSGWGVATHQLALTGLLRDELQRRAGREVFVELVGDELLDVQTAASWVGDRAQDGWDVVVVAIGSNDASRLTSLLVWEREYRALVTRIRSGLGARVPLVLVELPPMSSIVPLRGVMTRFVTSHAQRMNAIVQQIAFETDSTVCVALPAKATESDRPWGSAAAYQPWADAIAPVVLDSLAEDRDSPRRQVRGMSPITEAFMDEAFGAGNRALQRLVDEVVVASGAASAQVNLIEGDRVYIAANSARGATKALPRSLTFCDVTVQEGELEVRDAATDPRFRVNPLLEIAGLTSYAGVAVHGPDGSPVGTVCLFNGATATGVDMDALRTLARTVEAELAHPSTSTPDAVESAHPVGETNARTSGLLSKVVGYAYLRVRGTRFSRDARQGRTAPVDQDGLQLIGPNPIRVLVYGGEYAVGYGAATRRDALDGAIANLLHQHTGRGVIVHNRSDEHWRLHELAARLGSTGAYFYDLVVWAPMYSEAARYTTLSPWRRGMTAMLTRIRDTSNAGTVLLSIPLLLGSQPIAVIGRWRARQIEQALRQITERTPKALVVTPPPVAMQDLATASGPHVYADTAAAALPAMLELLNIRLLDTISPVSSDMDAHSALTPMPALRTM
jgi:lysophospholipase L1-like esterase